MPEDVRQVPITNSSGAGATAGAPTSGTAFVAVTPLAGIYRAYFVWTLTGTTETTLNNVRIKTKGANLMSGLPAITGQVITLIVDRIEADGTNAISLCANAASTAGSVYTGCIVLSQIG